MPEVNVYRVCMVGMYGGVSLPNRLVLCRTDDDMLTIAGYMMRGDAKAEVWQGIRLVGKVSAWSVEKLVLAAPVEPEPGSPMAADTLQASVNAAPLLNASWG